MEEMPELARFEKICKVKFWTRDVPSKVDSLKVCDSGVITPQIMNSELCPLSDAVYAKVYDVWGVTFIPYSGE
jgi:hypothetical protein